VAKRGVKLEEFFAQHAGSDDKIPEETFCRLVSSLEGASFPPEHLQLVARNIEVDGLGRRRFFSFLQQYYVVVKTIAITPEFDISKTKPTRKAELDEVIEVLEGPRYDDKLKMTRVRGKSLADGAEGWVSVKGNQGTPFLQEVEKPYYACTTEVALEQDSRGMEPPLRTLKADEVLELIEGPRKEAYDPSLRAKGKAAKDEAQGWFTIRDKKGSKLAESDEKCYRCSAPVAMTDELDIKSSKVLRKLAAGETLTVLEGPVEEKAAGITRLKVRATKDEKEGWVTTAGNKGTVYVEPHSKQYSVLQGQPLTKAFRTSGRASTVEEVRTLEKGEVMELTEGPKEEQHPQETRLRVRALSDGAVGWISLQGSNVKAWSPYYKVLKAGPINDSKEADSAKTLRDTVAGEGLELLEGPELQDSGAVRMKARAEKDGVVGWVVIKDAGGARFCGSPS